MERNRWEEHEKSILELLREETQRERDENGYPFNDALALAEQTVEDFLRETVRSAARDLAAKHDKGI